MTERIGSERSAVQNGGTEPTLQKCLDELETVVSQQVVYEDAPEKSVRA